MFDLVSASDVINNHLPGKHYTLFWPVIKIMPCFTCYTHKNTETKHSKKSLRMVSNTPSTGQINHVPLKKNVDLNYWRIKLKINIMGLHIKHKQW